jgi:hypothetical protein
MYVADVKRTVWDANALCNRMAAAQRLAI